MHENLTKDLKEVLFDQATIQARVAELGKQISDDYRGSNRQLLVIGILRGSVVFYSDLIRQIEGDVVVDFMSLSSYGMAHKTTGEVRMLKDLDESLDGKDVIVVEDIIDTGLTLQYLSKVLLSRKPNSLKLCCLLDKVECRKVDLKADYVGFTIPNAFVVGYGLDYAQRYRNLPFIGILDPKVYTK